MSIAPLLILSVVFNRNSVQRAIKRIIQKFKTIKAIPVNGIAIFCGEQVCEVITPPLPITSNSYYCDNKFHIELVENLFNTYKTIGYAIITSQEVILITVTGPQRTKLYHRKTDLATNTRRGGQSANRLARIRDEKRHNYSNKIIEAVIKYLNNIYAIIICGNAEFAAEIGKELQNDSRLTTPILGTVKIAGILNPIEESIEASFHLLHQDEIGQEKMHIDKIRLLIETNPDKCIFGIDNIKACMDSNLLEYVITNNPDLNYHTIIRITYHDYLSQFDGSIGILYYPQSSHYLPIN